MPIAFSWRGTFELDGFSLVCVPRGKTYAVISLTHVRASYFPIDRARIGILDDRDERYCENNFVLWLSVRMWKLVHVADTKLVHVADTDRAQLKAVVIVSEAAEVKPYYELIYFYYWNKYGI